MWLINCETDDKCLIMLRRTSQKGTREQNDPNKASESHNCWKGLEARFGPFPIFRGSGRTKMMRPLFYAFTCNDENKTVASHITNQHSNNQNDNTTNTIGKQR